jgi:hypothetical protein
MRRVKSLSPVVEAAIERQDGIYEIGGQSYVDGDYPRDAIVAEEIVANTIDFALVDEGSIIKTFQSLRAADAAKASARVVFDYEVELGDEVEPAVVAVDDRVVSFA